MKAMPEPAGCNRMARCVVELRLPAQCQGWERANDAADVEAAAANEPELFGGLAAE